MHDTAIVWFRRDLRIADNPALVWAAHNARAVIPFAVRAKGGDSPWRAASLASLAHSLESLDTHLWSAPGPARESLLRLVASSKATAVAFNRDWAPDAMAEETLLLEALESAGVTPVRFDSAHAVPPAELMTGAGTPYRVFTPYFRAWERAGAPGAPLAAPGAPLVTPGALSSDRPVRELEAAGFLTGVPGSSSGADPRLADWTPGEAGALMRLTHFIDEALADYDTMRDRPDVEGTSRLSPHLAHGEITPRQILHAIQSAGMNAEVARPFVRQLAWRDFAAHVLHHNPGMESEPLRSEWNAMKWLDDDGVLDQWKRGLTGFPLVDAGMRELAATGWMHNRVRLVAASFLVKDLLLDWREGLEHFRGALFDADPAQNAFNWQWVAGSGADAAPYFRIFNPVVQAKRFDPLGTYVRRWVPELTGSELAGTGGAYPSPMVDHGESRMRALAAYDAVKHSHIESGE